jgi:phosphoribosylaminoimidazole carboxylase PurK protein
LSFPKVGILGGGQLARMLCEAASAALGLKVHVFTDNKDCPAATVTDLLSVGSMNIDDVSKFIELVDIVLFESEFVDVNFLREVENQIKLKSQHKFSFYPSLTTMSSLQDKLLQKQLCVNADCPTSKWEVFDADIDIAQQVQSFKNTFTSGAVLKWSRNGYDGKGNLFVTNWDSQLDQIKSFIQEGSSKSAVTYAEQMIKFQKELAIVCIRDKSKKIHSYPVVVSEQLKGTCLNVFGPASNAGVASDIQEKVFQIAANIGEKSDIIGAYAVELFLTENNQLLVNEIAPRVHNTGHYTQDCTNSSQFENHIRAILDLPIEKIVPNKPYFGMRNILGPIGINKDECQAPKNADKTFLHWYYKKGTKPGRKLGHINVNADTKEQFDLIWSQALQVEQEWIKNLSNK